MNSEIFENINGILPKAHNGFLADNWMWIVPVIMILVLLLGTILARTKKVKELSPYERSLLKLNAAKLEEDSKNYASLVSDAIREYISAIFDIPAPERTTQEFLIIATQNVNFQKEQKEKIESILTLADMAKFAATQFGQEQKNMMFDLAQDFIDSDNLKRISKK